MKPLLDGEALLKRLPPIRGRAEPMRTLADLTWFRAGGPAEVLATPADEEDLATLLAGLEEDIPVTVIGAASNLLVRDGGVPGVVIRLGRGFGGLEVKDGTRIVAGAAVPDVRVARFALDHGITGLTFLRGIPGTIGGALRMNAGAHGGETRDIAVEARGLDRRGSALVLSNADMGFSYRHSEVPADVIFVSGLFEGRPGDKAEIEARMREVTEAREASQPIKSRTGGSTFTNPPGRKAWQLIDAAGMRGHRIGAAVVSTMHCNFLINEGGASAADIETLGETVRERVKETSGIELHWEIKRIGLPAARLD